MGRIRRKFGKGTTECLDEGLENRKLKLRTYSIFGVLAKKNALIGFRVSRLDTLAGRGRSSLLLGHILILVLGAKSVAYRVELGPAIDDVILNGLLRMVNYMLPDRGGGQGDANSPW